MPKTPVKKKYVLALKDFVFDSMESLSAKLVMLAEQDGVDVNTLVIGSYIGSPEITTSLAVNIDGKTKRINKSSIKWTPTYTQQPPAQMVIVPQKAAEVKPEAPTVEPEAESTDNDGLCSFCGQPWVRKKVVEGFDTFLCEFHLNLEAQLAKIRS